MNRLKDKVAIVTGSTSGIGIGIARLYAAEGAKVIICGRRKEKGQAVVDMITQEGGEASYHFMDITDPSSIETLIADTVEKYGKIDILVNNAANVALKDGRVDELTRKCGTTFSRAICAVPSMPLNAYCLICRKMKTAVPSSILDPWLPAPEISVLPLMPAPRLAWTC